MDNFFVFFFFGGGGLLFLHCCCYMWPSARCGGNLQFHGHHSYFRKDFQMLLADKKGEI